MSNVRVTYGRATVQLEEQVSVRLMSSSSDGAVWVADDLLQATAMALASVGDDPRAQAVLALVR